MSFFYCCDSKITSKNDFKFHYFYSHFDGSQDQVNFRCLFCERTILYYKNLRKHFETYHRLLIGNIFQRPEVQTQNDDPEDHFQLYPQQSSMSISDPDSGSDQGKTDSSDDEDDEESSKVISECFSQVSFSPQPFPLSGCKIDLRSEVASLILSGKRDFKMTTTAIIGFLKKYNELLLKLSLNQALDTALLDAIGDYAKSPYQVKKTLVCNSEVNQISGRLVEYQTDSSAEEKSYKF